MSKFVKSGTNKPAPFVEEGKAKGAQAPHKVPNRPGSAEGHVLMKGASVAKPAGKGSGSTFSAPRKDGSMDPYNCGYTTPGKMK